MSVVFQLMIEGDILPEAMLTVLIWSCSLMRSIFSQLMDVDGSGILGVVYTLLTVLHLDDSLVYLKQSWLEQTCRVHGQCGCSTWGEIHIYMLLGYNFIFVSKAFWGSS